MKPSRSESEILQDLIERAERLFGKDRALELRADLEQAGAEMARLYEFPIGPVDEP